MGFGQVHQLSRNGRLYSVLPGYGCAWQRGLFRSASRSFRSYQAAALALGKLVNLRRSQF